MRYSARTGAESANNRGNDMKQTVSFTDFRDAFRAYGRMDAFSREGAQLLYDYLEEIDPDWELDVIALCCDWCESSTSEIIAENNLAGYDEIEPDMDAMQAWLEERTTVLGRVGDGFVYATF